MFSTGTLIHVLCADPFYSVDFIAATKEAGLVGAGNVWITPMAFSSAFDASNTTEWYNALEGFIYASPLEDTGNQYATEMKALWNQQYPGRKFPTYGMLYRDCMYSMAEGLLKLVDRHGYDRIIARNYSFNLFNLVRTFTGASGAITLDDWGDRQQDFVFKNIWNGTVHDTYLLPVESTSLLTLDQPLRFPGGSTEKPIDHVPKVLINEMWGTIGGTILGAFTVGIMSIISGTIVYLVIHRDVPQSSTSRFLSFA
ncbi:hypothetical protein BCR44DRAFT_1013971 [Catenaria anguillulae PL171]|uniref:Receptor ligand binding region domain-containing protein n=1 Tax=Catenaria anguillulae PL171 TaxID=765915 RepID=A0A1Y2HVD4_9FUNG|nr:hypothetical protein BCR44DRAFT_1013971 [Catenaria anguillulae PL171]